MTSQSPCGDQAYPLARERYDEGGVPVGIAHPDEICRTERTVPAARGAAEVAA